MRKNIYTFLAMIAMGTAVAGAEVLLEENFDYPQGEFPLETGVWYTQWGGASSLSIGEGLTFEGYAGSGVGNGVVIDADDSNNPHRAFKQVTEGNVYVAFMLRPFTAYKKGYFLTLRDEKVNDYYSFNFNGRVSVNESGQLGLTFANNQNAVYADEVLDGNTTYLVVLKYAIVEGKNNDNVSLYCFDKMPDAEPATPLVGPLSDAAKVDINPANIALRGYAGADYVELMLDGIRVATTWDEALGKQASAETVKADGVSVVGQKGALQLTAGKADDCTVYTLDGRQVGRYEVAAGTTSVALPQGLYVVKFGTQTFKAVVR